MILASTEYRFGCWSKIKIVVGHRNRLAAMMRQGHAKDREHGEKKQVQTGLMNLGVITIGKPVE